MWVWHSAQPKVSPSQTVAVVLARSLAVLTRNSSSLSRPTADAVEHRHAVEAGGDALLERRAGEQVAGQLLDREPVEGHVGG